MAFKMKGMSFGNSPIKQMGPVTKSNIGLLETENKDANVYKGNNLQERINDYEDRIEFLNSDLDDGGQQPGQDPKEIKMDIKKLTKELSILEKMRSNKNRPDPEFENADEVD
tara:strand:+ start:337 stop:672 length:336 start_codon:yes stop_codon:yes gene_type:complete